MDAANLSKAMGGTLPMATYQSYVGEFNTALRDADCTTVNRAAMFCAQMAEESHGLAWLTELASGAEYEGRKDLGNTQPGWGRKYKGRGIVQCTGADNYRAFGSWAKSKGLVTDANQFFNNPDQVAQPKWAFIVGTWFWTTHGLNQLADAGDVHGATLRINGGLNNLAERTANWNRCRALGNALLPGPVLTKVTTMKVGDTALVTSPTAAARTAPGGSIVTKNGKQVAQPKGKQFTIKALKKTKDNQLWVSGGQYYYSAARLTAYRKM